MTNRKSPTRLLDDALPKRVAKKDKEQIVRAEMATDVCCYVVIKMRKRYVVRAPEPRGRSFVGVKM